MAASTRQYKLRSARQDTVELPVEIHTSQDSTFMKELLASQQDPSSEQVSDNESSINDSDCEALIASSDDDNEHIVNRQRFAKKSDPTDSDSQSMSQQAINVKILEQLHSLGKRLDNMERKSCKKSTDTTKIKNKGYIPKVKTQTAVTLPPVTKKVV